MSFQKIPQQLWMMLTREQRVHLAQVFDIKKTGVAEIRDSEVISDGHSSLDLEGITAEKMEAYVGSSESFSRLWELTVAKCKYELNPPQELPHAALQTIHTINNEEQTSSTEVKAGRGKRSPKTTGNEKQAGTSGTTESTS